MLTEQCQRDLNTIMNHLRKVGVNLMSVRRAFEKAKDMGIACMLKNESMERWQLGGEIADYIICEDGIVEYAATPAPDAISANIASISQCLQMDKETVDVLDNMFEQAMARQSFKTALFMKEFRHCVQKEYNELRDITAELSAVVNNPAEMIMYDKFLYNEYSNKHGYENKDTHECV